MKHFLSILYLAIFAFSFSLQAQTLVLNATTAESVSKGFGNRTFYNFNDLIFIYRASTDAFEAQVKTTRNKVWGGDIDSVTISGASTTTLKLARLRLWAFETTTTTGYRSFIARNNIKYEYIASSNRLTLKDARNDQMLWFGNIDSLQVSGVSGAANKLAYVRAQMQRPWLSGVLGSGAPATVAAGAGAGTSPTIAITGDAVSGEITLTTGSTTTTGGVLFTVTFPTTAPTGNNTVFSGSNDTASAHINRVTGTNTTTTFVLTANGTALTAATQYKWKYFNVSY